jgi:hypothetical protein
LSFSSDARFKKHISDVQKVLTAWTISLDSRPFPKLMTLVWIILAIVCNDPGEALHPFLEDALDVCESEVIPHFGNGTQNRLLALELAILHLGL